MSNDRSLPTPEDDSGSQLRQEYRRVLDRRQLHITLRRAQVELLSQMASDMGVATDRLVADIVDEWLSQVAPSPGPEDDRSHD